MMIGKSQVVQTGIDQRPTTNPSTDDGKVIEVDENCAAIEQVESFSDKLIDRKENMQLNISETDSILNEDSIKEKQGMQSSSSTANKIGIYSWFVLGMLFLMRIGMNWQRKSLSYIYGYKGLGDQAGNAAFEIGRVYPQLDQSYGILQGMAYTIPFSLCGVVLGMLGSGYNRKTLLSSVVMVGGLTQFLTGSVTSFPLLCVMRSLHGACFSLTIPLLSSILRDYFPLEKRGTANSILYSANYFGTALSSISVMIISAFGWRATYGLMGVFGLVVGLTSMLFVREP